MIGSVGQITPQETSAHTGWHYYSWCDSGWRLYYNWYAYANPWGGHGPTLAYQAGSYGYCSWW
jgi:hypothetical protein